jgi:hypothetical protein
MLRVVLRIPAKVIHQKLDKPKPLAIIGMFIGIGRMVRMLFVMRNKCSQMLQLAQSRARHKPPGGQK